MQVKITGDIKISYIYFLYIMSSFLCDLSVGNGKYPSRGLSQWEMFSTISTTITIYSKATL